MGTVHGYYNHPHVAAQLFPDYASARRASFGGYGGLGDFESDLKRIFAAIPGASGAYDDLVALIQAKAKEGAEQAIPTIKASIQPYIIVTALIGLGGLLFGYSAYRLARANARPA